MTESPLQSAERLKPVRSRLHFDTSDLYDLNLAVLTHCTDGNLERMRCMQRCGVINNSNFRLHICIIGSLGDFDYVDKLCNGWEATPDVSLIEMPSTYPTPKINGYYLWLMDSGLQARWHGRVDDDSMTDVPATLAYLDSRFRDASVHVASSPVFEREDTPCFVPYLQNQGLAVSHSRHEFESSFTSRKGMQTIFEDATVRAMIVDTGNHFQLPSRAAPGDRTLALGAQITQVPLADNPKSRGEFWPDRFSAFGGDVHHIHHVPWHKSEVRQPLIGLSQRFNEGISDDTLRNLLGQHICFYNGPREVCFLTLLPNGTIIGGEHRGLNRWEKRRSSLHFKSNTGEILASFEVCGAVENELMLGGFGTRNDKRMLLRVPAFANNQNHAANAKAAIKEEIAATLCKHEHIYYRIGYDWRLMTFSQDGNILSGSASNELYWEIEEETGSPVLIIAGKHQRTCSLNLCCDGVWRGNWLVYEKMPIAIFPLFDSHQQVRTSPRRP